MRVSRSLLPEEIWGQITQLHEAIETAPSRLYSRRHRVRQLRDIVMSCRAIIGVLLASLRRGRDAHFLEHWHPVGMRRYELSPVALRHAR